MSDGPAIALIAVYPNRAYADAAVAHLLDVVASDHLQVDGIAVVTKDADGKVKAEEVGKSAGKHGTKRGAVVGAVVGTIFPPSILAATVAGAAIGGVIDHLRGKPQTHRRLQSIGEQIDRGHAGVIVIVGEAESGRVASGLLGYEQFHRVPLDVETSVPEDNGAISGQL